MLYEICIVPLSGLMIFFFTGSTIQPNPISIWVHPKLNSSPVKPVGWAMIRVGLTVYKSGLDQPKPNFFLQLSMGKSLTQPNPPKLQPDMKLSTVRGTTGFQSLFGALGVVLWWGSVVVICRYLDRLERVE